jgi:hypothetical protein
MPDAARDIGFSDLPGRVVQLRQGLWLHASQRGHPELHRGGRALQSPSLRERSGALAQGFRLPDGDAVPRSVSLWLRAAGVEPRARPEDGRCGGRLGYS